MSQEDPLRKDPDIFGQSYDSGKETSHLENEFISDGENSDFKSQSFIQFLISFKLNLEKENLVDKTLLDFCKIWAKKMIEKHPYNFEFTWKREILNWPSRKDRSQILSQIITKKYEIDDVPQILSSDANGRTKSEALRVYNQKEREFVNSQFQRLVQSLNTDEIKKIERELEFHLIVENIKKTIFLDRYYISLKSLGREFWKLCTNNLKILVDAQRLSLLGEESLNMETQNIEDWVKGVVLYLSLFEEKNTRTGDPIYINPKTLTKVNPITLKKSIQWVFGYHLNAKGRDLKLKETIQIMENFKILRKKSGFKIVYRDPAESPEVNICPPINEYGRELDWYRFWDFQPNTDREIREIAEVWRENPRILNHTRENFKTSMVHRIISSICRYYMIQSIYHNRPLNELTLPILALTSCGLLFPPKFVGEKERLIIFCTFVETFWKFLYHAK